MKTIRIDGQAIESPSDLFKILDGELKHDEFHPTNLDALNDLLSELDGSQYTLELVKANHLRDCLGNRYFYRFLQVFMDNDINIMLFQ